MLASTLPSPLFSSVIRLCAYKQALRTAVVVSRQFPVKTLKEDVDMQYFRPKLKRREWVYRLDRVTNDSPAGNMDLILTVDIEGIGFKGETINVSKKIGRLYLLPSGAAVYATDENLAKWVAIRKNLPESVKQSIWARKTMRQLSEMTLPIPMHPHNPWTLSASHVQVAFRKQGVELNENCLSLPEEPITEHGPTKVNVKVNGVDSVEVNAIIFPVDLDFPDELPEDFPPVWGDKKTNLTDIIIEALERNQLSSGEDSVS